MGRSISIVAAIVAVLAAAGAYFYFSGSDPGPSGKSLADAAAVLEEVCLQEARDQEIRGRMVRKICACAMESLKERLPGDLLQGGDFSRNCCKDNGIKQIPNLVAASMSCLSIHCI